MSHATTSRPWGHENLKCRAFRAFWPFRLWPFALITSNHKLKVSRVLANIAFFLQLVPQSIRHFREKMGCFVARKLWGCGLEEPKTRGFVARKFSGCALSEHKRDVLWPVFLTRDLHMRFCRSAEVLLRLWPALRSILRGTVWR